MSYKIITDSCCDLSVDKLKELDVTAVSLSLMFRGAERADAVTDDIKEVYDAMRAGETATTSAANPDNWANVIEPVLAEGKDALVIAFSSGLSTTYQSAVIAAEDLKEKYPDRKVNVVDSLCASLGQGLLVWYACDKRDEGMDLDTLTAWLEENKHSLCQWFTVDDLHFLKRGGRISAATALVGTMRMPRASWSAFPRPVAVRPPLTLWRIKWHSFSWPARMTASPSATATVWRMPSIWRSR